MENSYISHHGIKGQKWGVRRYQNPDGSLTWAGKRRLKKNEKTEAAKAKQKAKEEREKETTEQRRERLLKSSNAKELYENRHLLTTQELNERLQRIDTERRLGDVASKGEKSKFDKTMERVDKIVKVGQKVNDVYKLTESDVGKAIKKSIFGEAPDPNDAKNLLTKDVMTMTTKQLGIVKDHLEKQASVKKLLNERSEKKSYTIGDVNKIIRDIDTDSLNNLSTEDLAQVAKAANMLNIIRNARSSAASGTQLDIYDLLDELRKENK